jgi:NAD(P)-dependent dehydrogenase (short-subunit alcohol dehydrogenase family)
MRVDLPPQTGRTYLITGGNSGIGLRSACVLAGVGARVLLACRDPDRGGEALAHVGAHATDAPPELVALDLADLSSVARAASEIAARLDSLDVLINNAGVMALPPARSVDGYEMHLATNHLGHFALTLRLLPVLLGAPAPRVVTVGSLGHWTGRIRCDDLHWQQRHYWPWLAYSQSKLANLLFMRELDTRARDAGLPLVSVAAHPGGAKTELSRHVVSPVRARVYGALSRFVTQSADDGAMPSLVAATDPALAGGAYVGPQGPLGLVGPPGPARLSPRARDPQTARRLWTVSEELTGVRFDDVLHRATERTMIGAEL